ncbi:MAG: hypothetical protein FWH24_06165 [Oscillospiraceae bacterium]|nr:hypothetical protein [Oscillospiraceae bacterium]
MNLDENTSFFRESFKGFNKDDVAAFIQKLSKDYADNEEKYKERINKLTNENNAKIKEIEDLITKSSSTDRISEQLYEKNTEIENLNNLLKTSTSEVDKYKEDANKLLSEVRAKDAEIIELKKAASVSENSGSKNESEFNAKIEELKKEKDNVLQAANNALKEKDATLQTANNALKEKDAALQNTGALLKEKDAIISELRNRLENNKATTEDEQKIYETVTADLGNIIYSAKKTAEDIIEKAKGDAAEVIEQANLQKHKILENNERNFAKLKETYAFIKTEHNKIIENFNAFTSKYSSALLETKNIIDNIGNNI